MEEKLHSRLGIASFIVSIVSGFSMFLMVGAAAVMVSRPGGMDEQSAEAIILGLLLLASIGASLVALGLGIGGLFQINRQKIFAILGTVFSATTLLGITGLFLLGMVIE